MSRNLKTGIVVLIIMLFVYIASIGAWIGVKIRNEAILQFTLVMANILMAGVVAIQALATAESTEQVKRQAELMNESLLEMKKQRLNLEEFKNGLLAYLQDLIGALTANSIQSRNFEPVFGSYMYLVKEYHLGSTTKYLPPSYRGLILRISKVIEKFLKKYGFPTQELREYGELISKFKNSKTPEEERLELARVIPEKSQELLDIVKRIYDGTEEMGDKKLEEEILKILES